MEIELLLKNIKDIDANFAKRMEPIEAAIGQVAVHTEGLAEAKKGYADLKAMLEKRETSFEDLRKLVMATQKSIYEPDKYNGSWPTREAAKRFGLWIMATMGSDQATRQRCATYLENVGIKALAEGVNATGGALVPEVFIPNLIVLMETYGKFRANAQVVPMSSDSATWPKLDSDVTGYVPGEAATITASNPTFSNVQLLAKKFAALTAISSELLEDSAVSVGEIVGNSMARTFAKMEDQAGFLGDGTSTYWGMTGVVGALRAVSSTIANIKSLIVGTGNAYSELVLPDFDKVCGILPDYAEAGAKWYMHKYFWYTVVLPKIQAYSSSIPTIGAPVDIVTGLPRALRGYPIEWVNIMPKAEANSQICATLMNLKMGAYLGNRAQLRIEQSREVYFTTDQIGLRGLERVAINVFGAGDTTDAGPCCGLITAAT